MKHIAKVLQLVVPDGYTEESATAAATTVYELELKLAGSHMTKTEKRDPEKVYNKMSLDAVTELSGGTFDIKGWLASLSRSLCLSLCHSLAVSLSSLSRLSSRSLAHCVSAL